MGFIERNDSKSNCLTEPAFEKSSFSNPFSQSRWGILSETHLKKTAFSNPFCQSRWSILSETLQKSNGLGDGPTENASFLINFVNRDELYWTKRFKNQTCKKDFFQILFGVFRPVSIILQPMKNTYVFFKYTASCLINFVNRDELYWTKRFKTQTVWQTAHLKMLLF